MNGIELAKERMERWAFENNTLNLCFITNQILSPSQGTVFYKHCWFSMFVVVV
jgi:hypothetical protein